MTVNSELASPENATENAGRAAMSTTPTARRPHSVRSLVTVLVVAAVGLGACSSDPGPKRVAEDIIDTAVLQGDLTEEQGKCMFDRVEAYSDDDLEAITKSAGDAGPGTAIELFEADLAACK